MILNLKGKIIKDQIEFDLPPLYFQKNHWVHVNYLFIKWSNSVKNLHGQITSTLIDRSPFNNNQEILFFTNKSNFLLFTPTHVAKYKIQCPCLQSSVFNISLSEKHEIAEIQLQLKITHEGLQ